MNYLKKILALITKKGKKTIAFKTVNQSIFKLKKFIPPSRIERALHRLVPSVKIYKKKVAGKVYQIPAVIKKERAIFQTAKWIIQAANEEKGKKFSVRLSKMIWEAAIKKGNVWKFRQQYLSVIKENRSYMRFIKKKRKKKKKWVFQHRFSSKVYRKVSKFYEKKGKKKNFNLYKFLEDSKNIKQIRENKRKKKLELRFRKKVRENFETKVERKRLEKRIKISRIKSNNLKKIKLKEEKTKKLQPTIKQRLKTKEELFNNAKNKKLSTTNKK